jgi:hypothetical protein
VTDGINALLIETRVNLTDAEVDQIVKSVGD